MKFYINVVISFLFVTMMSFVSCSKSFTSEDNWTEINKDSVSAAFNTDVGDINRKKSLFEMDVADSGQGPEGTLYFMIVDSLTESDGAPVIQFNGLAMGCPSDRIVENTFHVTFESVTDPFSAIIVSGQWTGSKFDAIVTYRESESPCEMTNFDVQLGRVEF